MKHVKKSVLLWYSSHEMYGLVTDVARYPEFLPWCDKAEILAQGDEGVTARLSLSFAGVQQAFTTRNSHTLDSEVGMALVDGPFSTLDGVWNFKPLKPPGDDDQAACKVTFELRYEFSSRALEAVISPVFDRIANTFVDSFVQRAEAVYGPR